MSDNTNTDMQEAEMEIRLGYQTASILPGDLNSWLKDGRALVIGAEAGWNDNEEG